MPIYEYQCSQCGQIEEAIQKFSDAPLTTCQNCSGQLQKLVSQGSFHLKGTGWYVTDYKDNPRKETKTDNKVDSKSTHKEKSKTDTKANDPKKIST